MSWTRQVGMRERERQGDEVAGNARKGHMIASWCVQRRGDAGSASYYRIGVIGGRGGSRMVEGWHVLMGF